MRTVYAVLKNYIIIMTYIVIVKIFKSKSFRKTVVPLKVSDDFLTISGHRYDYQRRRAVALGIALVLSPDLLVPLSRWHQGEPRSESRGTARKR